MGFVRLILLCGCVEDDNTRIIDGALGIQLLCHKIRTVFLTEVHGDRGTVSDHQIIRSVIVHVARGQRNRIILVFRIQRDLFHGPLLNVIDVLDRVGFIRSRFFRTDHRR